MSTFESSVIIPTYNNWDLTRSCLKSLAATTDRSKVEIIVVDTASTDATPKGCLVLGKQLFGDSFRFIANRTSKNWAEAWNQGAVIAQGEFFIFLNHDTEVQKNWYEPLRQDFNDYPDLAATSSLLLYPNETPLGRLVKDLGLYISPCDTLGQLYHKIPVASPLASERRFFQAISGACLMIRQKLFKKVGQFDERFIFGLEDVDLCFRIALDGSLLTVNPNSQVIYHDTLAEERRIHRPRNLALLKHKFLNTLNPDWQDVIDDDGFTLNGAWNIFSYAMSKDRVEELDGKLASMNDAELKEAIIANPYWENGWVEFLLRNQNEAEQKALFNIYLSLFEKPTHIFNLWRVPWVVNNKIFLAECVKKLRTFFVKPKEYLDKLNATLKNSAQYGLVHVAAHLSAISDNYEQFCATDLVNLAKEIWRLEGVLDKLHSVDDQTDYRLWHYAVEQDLQQRKFKLIEQEYSQDPSRFPHFSILLPLKHPKHNHLSEAIDSLINQSYQHWELCLEASANIDTDLENFLTEYTEKDSRIKFVKQSKTLKSTEESTKDSQEDHTETNNAVKDTSKNTALDMAQFPWICSIGQSDLLPKDALAIAAKYIVDHPEGLFFYTDEDTLKDNSIVDPYFKPSQWDLELIYSQNFAAHLAIYKTERLKEISANLEGQISLNSHNLVLRYTSECKTENLVHIPYILYHCREEEEAPSTSKSTQSSKSSPNTPKQNSNTSKQDNLASGKNSQDNAPNTSQDNLAPITTETKESCESNEVKTTTDVKESTESNEVKVATDVKESAESSEVKAVIYAKESTKSNEVTTATDAQESAESSEAKAYIEAKESTESSEVKTNTDAKESTEIKTPAEDNKAEDEKSENPQAQADNPKQLDFSWLKQQIESVIKKPTETKESGESSEAQTPTEATESSEVKAATDAQESAEAKTLVNENNENNVLEEKKASENQKSEAQQTQLAQEIQSAQEDHETQADNPEQIDLAWLEQQIPGATLEALPNSPWQRLRYPKPTPMPKVSLISQITDPRFALDAYQKAWLANGEADLEMILVCSEQQANTLSGQLPQDKTNIRLLPLADTSSKAQCLQLGAEKASGEVLGFIDEHLLPKQEDWLDELVAALWRKDVGAVGAKIINRREAMLQGGYLTNNDGALKPIFCDRQRSKSTYFGWTILARTVDALDFICLFTKQELFKKYNFDNTMNDLAAQDYCLRLRQDGLRSVWIPYCQMLIKRLKISPLETKPEFITKWQKITKPFNTNITIEGANFYLNSDIVDEISE